MSADSPNVTNEWLLYGDILTNNAGFPQFFTTPTKQSPSLAGGALWADEVNHRFYAFGGYFPSDAPQPFETWTYDDTLKAWSNVSTQGDSINYVAHGMSAVAANAGFGYYLGGYQDAQTQSGWATSRQYSSQLISFNMVTREYTNHSGPDGSGRGEGLMTFIPASVAGVLIYFGGVVQDPSSGDISGSPMEDIWMFDIDLQKWYTQKVTGDIPENRARFCGGVAWADDKSSYNIYLYGGIDPLFKTAGFGDVYILTMPAFVWTKMYVGDAYPHHSTSCDVVNGTQMIIMGGTFPNQTQMCDAPTVYGQHGADLGQINPLNATWSQLNYDNPPYRVPPLVFDIVGGTGKGGANVTAPKGNITYDKYLFEKEYKVSQRNPTPTPSATGTPASTSGPQTGASSTNRSALIGAIIGAVVGGICIGIASFYLYSFAKRRRSRSASVDHGVVQQSDEVKGAEEVEGHPRVELASKEPARELWTDPVELPGGQPVSPSRR